MDQRFRRQPQENHPVTDQFLVAQESDLSRIRKRVRADLKKKGVPPPASFDCLVALTEACTNALVHGRSRGRAAAEVTWTIDSDAAQFVVKDFSNRLWSIATHPSGRVRIEDSDLKRRIGGFGIDLMRRLMDEADISIQPHGTTVRLVKSFA
jgi:anti-sigma regulatory factor (Ser/Thr protein kinase)